MNKYHRHILEYIAKKIVRQSHDHEENIIEYYAIIKDASHNEFTEDSSEGVNAMLEQCFEDSMENWIEEDLNEAKEDVLGDGSIESMKEDNERHTKPCTPDNCEWYRTYIAIVLGMILYVAYLIIMDNYSR